MEELSAMVRKAIVDGRKKEEFIKALEVSSIRSITNQRFGEKIKFRRESFLDPVYITSVEEMVKNHVAQLWNIYSKK